MQGSFGGHGPTGRGSTSGAGGARGSFGAGPGRTSGSGRKLNTLCSSCKAPMSQDEVLMASATEGRCVACQQVAEAHSACRVCHLPWGPSDQTDVVACDACGFFMHSNCVKKGALQTKSGGRLYTYCPHCPPTIPPPGGDRGGSSARDRDRDTGPQTAGGGSTVKSERGRPSSQQRSESLSLSLGAAGPQPSGLSPGLMAATAAGGVGAGGGRGRGASGGSGAPDNNNCLAPLAAALALPVQPTPVLQQVAALLRGQLQMLQSQQQALLRQYELQLRAVTPVAQPSAYELFQADMFSVYDEETFEIDPHLDLQPIITNAWNQLTPDERAGYDNRAQQQLAAWSADSQLYVQLYLEYETLALHLGLAPDASLVPKALQGMLQAARQMAAAAAQAQAQARPLTGPGSGRGPGRPPGSGAGSRGGGGGGGGGAAAAAAGGGIGSAVTAAGAMSGFGAGGGGGSGGGGGGRGVKRSGMDALAGASALLGMNRGVGGMVGAGGEDDDDDDEDYEEGTSKRARRAISPTTAGAPVARPPPRNTRLPADKLPTGIADLPQQLTVSCNDVTGTFVMDGIKVVCHCRDCQDAPKAAREFHPTHWEQHCGAGTAKKWKASIKIEPGGAPEVPSGGNPMQIGKWFDMLGVEFRPAKTTGGPPVLEFTGATIRRLEAEGTAVAIGGSAGSGSVSGARPEVGAGLPQPLATSSGPPLGHLTQLQPAATPPAQDQPRQQPPQHQPQPPQQQQQQQQLPQAPPAVSAAAAVPRQPRSLQPTPPAARGSAPPSAATTSFGMGGGGGGGGGATARRTDDAPTTATATAAPPVKAAPRPVSDGDGVIGAHGDGDGEGEAAGYCLRAGPAAHAPAAGLSRGSGSGGGGGQAGAGGYDGDSSSRGSASDTLGPNTTPA